MFKCLIFFRILEDKEEKEKKEKNLQYWLKMTENYKKKLLIPKPYLYK